MKFFQSNEPNRTMSPFGMGLRWFLIKMKLSAAVEEISESEMEADRPYILSLGSGYHQMPLIRAARALGYRVISADRDPRAPGFAISHIRLQCSLNRPTRIYRLIEENPAGERPIAVAHRSCGQAGLSAAILAHKFRVPGENPAVMKLFSNKRKLKTRLAAAGIRMPQMYEWDKPKKKWAMIRAEKKLIVRPAKGQGKVGIQILKTKAGIREFLKKHSEDNESYLAEEYIKGKEITVLGLVKNGVYHPVCISDKITSDQRPYFAELMHRYPSLLPQQTQTKVHRVMQRIVNATGIRFSPIVAEFIMVDGVPNLVEVVPEAGGEYIADIIASRGAGINFFQEMIQGVLPEPDGDLQSKENQSQSSEKRSLPEAPQAIRSVVIRYIPQRSGVIQNLKFPPQLKELPGYIFARYLKNPGQRTTYTRVNQDRLAVFALEGPVGLVEGLERDADEIEKEMIIEYRRAQKSMGDPLSTQPLAALIS